MSRNTPEIFLRGGTENGKGETRVLAAAGIYTILYRGKPFSLTTDRLGLSRDGLKQPPIYQRTSFATKAPAANLAKKLNAMFDVEDFAVFDVEFV